VSCERCDELERDIAGVRDELTAAGRPGQDAETLEQNDLERELAKWLRGTHEPDAAAGFRAGWRRLAQLSSPRLREWNRVVFDVNREGDRLRARVGVLLREISRLSERG
jgi:hypothetical protein